MRAEQGGSVAPMRLGVRYDSVKERIGAALNLIPEPVGYSMFGMPIARAIQVAQRTGVLHELVTRPATAGELSERLGLRARGTSLLLDSRVGRLGGPAARRPSRGAPRQAARRSLWRCAAATTG